MLIWISGLTRRTSRGRADGTNIQADGGPPRMHGSGFDPAGGRATDDVSRAQPSDVAENVVYLHLTSRDRTRRRARLAPECDPLSIDGLHSLAQTINRLQDPLVPRIDLVSSVRVLGDGMPQVEQRWLQPLHRIEMHLRMFQTSLERSLGKPRVYRFRAAGAIGVLPLLPALECIACLPIQELDTLRQGDGPYRGQSEGISHATPPVSRSR